VEGSRIADASLSLRAILFILFILSKTLDFLLRTLAIALASLGGPASFRLPVSFPTPYSPAVDARPPGPGDRQGRVGGFLCVSRWDGVVAQLVERLVRNKIHASRSHLPRNAFKWTTLSAAMAFRMMGVDPRGPKSLHFPPVG